MATVKATAKNLVSKARFAALAKVSPPAVSKALREGRAVETREGKIYLNDPLNKFFIAGHHRKSLTAAPASAKGSARENRASSSSASLARRRLEADTALKIEQTLTHRQKRMERLGVLQLQELVDRRLALIGQEVRVHLLDLPQRLWPRLSALAKTDREGEGLALLEAEISAALERIVEKATA